MPCQIKIEIGDSNIKNQIAMEIEGTLGQLLDLIEKKTKLKINIEVIVPNDFDSTIKSLTGKTSYTGTRKDIFHEVQAIKIDFKDRKIIVLSKNLYSENNDTLIRCITYFHELIHAIFHPKPNDPRIGTQKVLKKDELTVLMQSLYREYYASRSALEWIKQLFSNISVQYNQHIIKSSQITYNNLIDRETFMNRIHSAIVDYKKEIITFTELLKIAHQKTIPGFLLTYVYLICYFDAGYDLTINPKNLHDIPGYNQGFDHLMALFRDKYKLNIVDVNNDWIDELYILDNVLLSLGEKLTDTENGLTIQFKLYY